MAAPPLPRPRDPEAVRTRARVVSHSFARALDLADRISPYLEHTWSAEADGRPALHLDDVSAIPFLVDIAGVEEYQHRGRLRARDGDRFAAVTPPAPGSESYFRDTLGLGAPPEVLAEPTGSPLAVAEACREGHAFEELCRVVRQSGAYAIHPYMGIEPVWDLARDLTAATGVPVAVLAPPPPVTWIANDKRTLSELVEQMVGPEGIVETVVTHNAPELATALRDLARRHERVALKRLRTASSMGNAVFDRRTVRDVPAEKFQRRVEAELTRMEWNGTEPVLAVAWEETDCSPSTQWWIPPLEGGAFPRLDGIYEQILAGPAKVFVGSRPSGLPDPIEQGLVDQSFPVAMALQELGYVGRCSFDHLVVGPLEENPALRITECNGRWGGTSSPMSLLDRLVEGPRPSYRAQDFEDPRLIGTTFTELCERLGDALFDARTGRGHTVLYNVGPLEAHGKFDIITIGSTQAEAEARLADEIPRRLGL